MEEQEKKDFAHKLLQGLIDDGFEAIKETDKGYEYCYGVLDSIKRIMELQKKQH